ncbi:CRE-NHR-185 protein [Caenorhabditis remanei]|uniref:CRE-NHR-185 protein n=1 Tax=Caenorhabditis remanei TaxID=31234 RepID=E3NEK0_CAERE|nr:CRE-NHR-185 protein [Caenorhabditis remanei]
MEYKPYAQMSQHLHLPIRCSVCNQQAYGMNYGVPSCNACKMFFRRVVILQPEYKCRGNDTCYIGINGSTNRPKCRACRFRRCLDVGMKYRCGDDDNEETTVMSTGQSHHPNILVTPVDTLCSMIRSLLHLDTRRYRSFERMESDEDPTIGEVLNRSVRGFAMDRMNEAPRSPLRSNQQILSQWSFFGVWTSIEFLNSLDFMSLLNPDDKQIILQSFAMNSYLLSSAFQSATQHSDRLLNPDGTELYPSGLSNMKEFSHGYVNRIQKLLVSKLGELHITSEEYILTTLILFCTPRLSGMSSYAQGIVTEQQRKYCNALMEYLKLTWKERAPQRFQEIISIGNVMAKSFEDVHYLVEMLKIFYPTSYNSKKLFVESLNK